MLPGHAESVYLTGRNIGDEYRYVLDRRGQRKYPGNMLDRPRCCSTRGRSARPRPASNSPQGGDDFRPAGERRRAGDRPHRQPTPEPAPDAAAAASATSPTSTSSPTPRPCC